MRFAFTIGSYRLHSFVRLSLAQLKWLSPESPVLVSDDASPESTCIAGIASEYGAEYRCSRVKKGHFSGDIQSIVNALAFGEAAGADVAIKISQRLILRRPEAIQAIVQCFTDKNILVATPGRPTKVIAHDRGSKGFSHFGILSDIVMIRVGALSPEDFLQMYRERIQREAAVPWASFVECAVDELHSRRFQGNTAKLEELTNPTSDPWYLRRYQATEEQYRQLADERGLSPASYPLNEWAMIERSDYYPKPLVV